MNIQEWSGSLKLSKHTNLEDMETFAKNTFHLLNLETPFPLTNEL